MKRTILAAVVLAALSPLAQANPTQAAPPPSSSSMVGQQLLPQVDAVRCFARSKEGSVLFRQRWLLLETNYRALVKVYYHWCNNLYGRDWVRPYAMSDTILSQRWLCTNGLRGYRVTFSFKDHYRNSSNYSKTMWVTCQNNGFQARKVYLSSRSTPRLFNTADGAPWVVTKTTADWANQTDGNGTRRLTMNW